MVPYLAAVAKAGAFLILPIKLTDQSGMNVGSGVPSFVIDPTTGVPFGIDIAGALTLVSDPATGEPIAQDSGVSQSGAASGSASSPGSVDFSNDPGLWDPNAPSPIVDDGTVLNTGALRNSHGTQWNRQGSYLTESQFDKWRKAGKPTACSMRGMGDTTTADRILQSIAAGASAAAQPYYPNYSQSYSQPGGSVTVSGGASSAAWIFGGLIVVGLAFVAMKKR